MVEEIRNHNGLIAYKHEVEVAKDSYLIFQLPRKTEHLSNSYVEGADLAIRKWVGEDRRPILLVGCDVNIYELTGAEATALKVKGII